MLPEFFSVIDLRTDKEPDIEDIALHEQWAEGLVYCDMEGFAICQDGTLMLFDECGNSVYCPVGRFKITINTPEPIEIETTVLGAMH